VERSRHIVDSLSNGQARVRATSPITGHQATRASTATTSRSRIGKGAVIDERYNGGGSAADYIVDILGRDYDGYFNNPAGDRVPFTSPAQASGARR
jgi:tricorn protease